MCQRSWIRTTVISKSLTTCFLLQDPVGLGPLARPLTHRAPHPPAVRSRHPAVFVQEQLGRSVAGCCDASHFPALPATMPGLCASTSCARTAFSGEDNSACQLQKTSAKQTESTEKPVFLCRCTGLQRLCVVGWQLPENDEEGGNDPSITDVGRAEQAPNLEST